MWCLVPFVWFRKKRNCISKPQKWENLRTSIIGIGGGIIYYLHYWGEIKYIEVGVIHLLIYAILFIVVLNLGFLPNKFLLRMFPSFTDKLGALVTFILIAIKPPYGIQMAMVWITLYTLWDYGKAFKVTVEASKAQINLPFFLKKSVFHLALAVFLTTTVVVTPIFSFVGAILLANIIFISLLMWNARYIKEQKSQTSTTTSSVSGAASQTAT